MATAFLAELWESIFTPGPSPVLLKAANATFTTLQVLLFVLFLATHSLHFVALSFICGGLWWAINWFAAEMAVAERQRAAEREQTEDSETEVEPSVEVPDARGSGGVALRDEDQGLRRRDPALGTQSSASTEDEWEKVSENENDKQK